MTRRTYASLSRRAAYWLRGGHSVVLDATYGRPEQRAAVRQLARRMGAGFVALFCRASDDVLRRRLAAREHESAGVSDARLELWPELRAAFVDPRDDMPEVSTISTSGSLRKTVAQAMNVICDRVSM
jgi:predicted kinase